MASQLFLGLGVLLAYAISLYGWGRGIARLSYGDSSVPWGFAMALGVAVWILLGGVLTTFSLVSQYAIYTIFLLGLLWICYFVWNWSRGRRIAGQDSVPATDAPGVPEGRDQKIVGIACYTCLAAVLIFQVLTTMPVKSFHIHDDLMLYLPRVERMAQTGAIHDMFDPVGLESFGAMSYLQALVYPTFPLPYIFAVDSVLCYLLCAVLVLELARELSLSWGHALLAMLLFLSIRIDEHNASAVYSGSLMVLLAILATCRLARSGGDGGQRLRAAIPGGLVLAGMAALKLSFALFAGCYLLILLAGVIASPHRGRQRIALVLAIGLVAAVAITPWLAPYGGKYLAMFRASPFGPAVPDRVDSILKTGTLKLWEMFSPERNWGLGSRLAYLVMIVLAAAASIVALVRVVRGDARGLWANLACAAAALAVVISFFFWQYFGLDTNNNLRYLGPLPAAVLPAAALLLIATSQAPASLTYPAQRVASRWPFVIVVSQALVIGLFLDTTFYRAQQAWSAPNFVGNLSPDRIRSIQSVAPEGSRILAWVKTPQYFDFARNEMCLVYQAGMVAPWLDFPSVANEQTADEFFRRYGIRFLLRERMDRGFPSGDNDINGMRGSRLAYFHRMGRNFAMLRDLMTIAEHRHKVVYNDGQIVLIDLAQ